jgi:hypothetical protein
VLGGDLGLHRIGPVVAGSRREREPLADLVPSPARAVLVVQQHQVAVLVQPGVPARVVQQHQREHTGRLGLVGH